MAVQEIYLKAMWRGKLINQSIGEWSRMTGVKRADIAGRHVARRTGKCNYTDEQVLFGNSNFNIIDSAFQKFCFSKLLSNISHERLQK